VPDLVPAQRASERRVPARIAEGGDLVEEHGRRKVRIVRQALATVGQEPQKVVPGRVTASWGPFPGQIRPHGFAISAQALSDPRGGPAPAAQLDGFHVFLLAQQKHSLAVQPGTLHPGMRGHMSMESGKHSTEDGPGEK
jgi:hypothetical protein